MKNMEFTEGLPFCMAFEYGRRKCQGCEKMRVGLYLVTYRPNGRYPPSRYAVCMACAQEPMKALAMKVESAKDADAYMLGSKL
jgi:hypothetical protein